MDKESDKFERGLFYGILTISIIVVIFNFYVFLIPMKTNQQITGMSVLKSKMEFTPFDAQLAKEFMDKNNDGLCDSCGMRIEDCIASGMMQCTMDSKSTLGVLGSQHIHADWKIYIDGKALDFSDKSHMERMRNNLPVSSFVHVDSGAPAPEKTGDVLHMHATGVPLLIFFDSIGLKLPNGAKVFANGKKISDYKNYVFNDLDKILITYGGGNLQEQLDSITDFAKIH